MCRITGKENWISKADRFYYDCIISCQLVDGNSRSIGKPNYNGIGSLLVTGILITFWIMDEICRVYGRSPLDGIDIHI